MPSTEQHSTPLRVGVVGLGKMGTLRCQSIAAHPKLSLVAVCDLRSDLASPWRSAKLCHDYENLLEQQLDVVFICTYNTIAPKIAVRALERGLHVFCEKPPGTCVQDVRRIIAAEQLSNGACLKFGFNHRYHHAVMEAKSLIDSGRFGDPLWVRGVYGKAGGIQFESSWRNHTAHSGGGILLDQGIHMLDLFLHLMGDFDQVQSIVTTAFWNVPVEDNAFALFRNSENGRVAMLHSSATQWKHRFSLEICLRGGYINLNGLLTSTRSYGDESLTIAKRQFEDEAHAFGRPREETVFFDSDESWALEVDDFVRAIEEQRPVQYGHTQDALRVMQLLEEVYRKGRQCS